MLEFEVADDRTFFITDVYQDSDLEESPYRFKPKYDVRVQCDRQTLLG